MTATFPANSMPELVCGVESESQAGAYNRKQILGVYRMLEAS